MKGLGLESWVEKEHAWLVLPNGIGGGWNDERPRRAESTGYADDPGFILAIKDWITNRFPVEPEKTLGAGFSNGAMLCQRLAARIPEHFQALASVCGAIPTAIAETALEVHPVSQYIFLGGKDTVIGNEFSDRYKWGEILTAQQTLDWWSNKWIQAGLKIENEANLSLGALENGVDLQETTLFFNQGKSITLAEWSPGGHFWPGSSEIKWRDETGCAVSLADRIWSFFDRQGIQGVED